MLKLIIIIGGAWFVASLLFALLFGAFVAAGKYKGEDDRENGDGGG